MLTLEQISKKEWAIINRQWYLGALFFIGAAVFAWFYVHTLQLSDELGQLAGARLVIAYIVFAACLGLGYLYNLWLKSRLEALSEARDKARGSNN